MGESVRKAAVAAKANEQAKKNAASSKHSKLRKAADKDQGLTGRLDKALQDIGTKLQAELEALKTTEIKLAGLPDPSTRIFERRASPAATAALEPAETNVEPGGQYGIGSRQWGRQ